MYSAQLLKVYQPEVARLKAQIFDLERRKKTAEEKLLQIETMMMGLESVAKHDAEQAPQLAAEREQAVAAAKEQGRQEGAAETITAVQAAADAQQLESAKPRRKRTR